MLRFIFIQPFFLLKVTVGRAIIKCEFEIKPTADTDDKNCSNFS